MFVCPSDFSSFAFWNFVILVIFDVAYYLCVLFLYQMFCLIQSVVKYLDISKYSFSIIRKVYYVIRTLKHCILLLKFKKQCKHYQKIYMFISSKLSFSFLKHYLYFFCGHEYFLFFPILKKLNFFIL